MITVIAGATGIVATPPGGGQRAEVDSGDTQAQGLDVVVTLPKGWTGRWDITETLRKV
jgi:uncharacterized cupin superfamily protein